MNESPQIEYKQCSTCGFATPATRTRCHNCWNRIDPEAPLLDPERAAELVARQEVYLAEQEEQRAAARRRRRLILGGIALLVVAWLGWWFYRSFIYTPPPVPEASNPSLQTLSGPDNWGTENGDLLESRQVDLPVPLDGDAAWTHEIGAEPATPLVADAERVYAVTDGAIIAVSIADGSVAWEFELQGAPFAAPTLAGDRLYVALRAGQLLALDAATGEVVFYSLNTGTRFGTSPLIADGYAYVFGIGNVVALDAEDGKVLWSTANRAGGVAFTNPAITEDHVAGVTGDEVLVYSRKNGAQTYFYEFTRAFPYSTVSRDGVVYVSSRRYTVAFEETSGRPWWEQWRAVWNQFWIWGMAPDVPIPDRIWQNNDPPIQDGFPGTIAGDLLIIASKEGEMQALNRADGSEAWRVTPAEGETAVRGPLATQDGIVLPLEDRIALYDPATGELIAERPVEGGLSDVIVTTAGMFVLTQDGALTVIR